MIKRHCYSAICMLLGSLLIAAAFNIFLNPAKIISGGAPGIATIVSEILPIKAGLIIFVCNVPILLWCFQRFGILTSIKTAVAGTLLPGVILLLEDIPQLYCGMLGNAVLGGIMTGLGISILYLTDASTGGTAAIAQIINSLTHWDKGKMLLVLDGSIVLSGLFIYPFEQMIYSVICVISLTTTITMFQTLFNKSKEIRIAVMRKS